MYLSDAELICNLTYLHSPCSVTLPADVGPSASTFVFISFLVAILYSVTSSLLGIAPDKLPYISERVNSVLPTANQLEEMLERENSRLKMTKEDIMEGERKQRLGKEKRKEKDGEGKDGEGKDDADDRSS